MARRPQAGGAVLPPISKNEVGIYRCARARLMAFTLLLHKLKPKKKERAAIGHILDVTLLSCTPTALIKAKHWYLILNFCNTVNLFESISSFQI